MQPITYDILSGALRGNISKIEILNAHAADEVFNVCVTLMQGILSKRDARHTIKHASFWQKRSQKEFGGSIAEVESFAVSPAKYYFRYAHLYFGAKDIFSGKRERPLEISELFKSLKTAVNEGHKTAVAEIIFCLMERRSMDREATEEISRGITELAFLLREDGERSVRKSSLLHWAVVEDCIDLVEPIALLGLSLNVRDGERQTPLHLACRRGSDDMITKLLGMPSIDPNVHARDSSTPLGIAAERRSLSIIKQFLDSPKVDPNLMGEENTPFSIACFRDKATVELMLKYPEVDVTLPITSDSPILVAAHERTPDVFKQIVESGRVRPGARNHFDGSFLFHWAFMEFNLEQLCLFIDSVEIDFSLRNGPRGDDEAREMEGESCLHAVCYTYEKDPSVKQAKVKRLLQEEGVRKLLNAQSKVTRETALHYLLASEYAERDLPTIQLLLEAGAEIDIADHKGRTALQLAKRCPAAKKLLERFLDRSPKRQRTATSSLPVSLPPPPSSPHQAFGGGASSSASAAAVDDPGEGSKKRAREESE